MTGVEKKTKLHNSIPAAVEKKSVVWITLWECGNENRRGKRNKEELVWWMAGESSNLFVTLAKVSVKIEPH
jgi:hypothetical protein